MRREFWLADVVDPPFDYRKKRLLRAFVYDEAVVDNVTSKCVVYTAQHAAKCKDQHETTGKCSKRGCKRWHWQPMDLVSVREPLLKTERDSRKHFKKVAGTDLSFMLHAGIAASISDTIAADDKLYYSSVGTID